MIPALAAIDPHPTLDRLLADLVPPIRFADARLDTYIPDASYPSQERAKRQIADFAAQVNTPRGSGFLSRLGFGRSRSANPARGIYLDGGFGVGKTHLLGSLFHETTGHRAYGTFVEYTNLVGLLGFTRARDTLAQSALVCIDEFELDDPGDTLIMTRLIRELSDQGVFIAATSNTLPEALGEGRFAAQDFMREIQAMSDRFEVIRIDGVDYRGRSAVDEIPALPASQVRELADGSAAATLDQWPELLKHLEQIHPSRYGALIDGVAQVHLVGVSTVDDHNDALRLVVLIDRLYDRKVPVLAAGADEGSVLPPIYTEKLLGSGYRKKYYRSLSRLASLARDGYERAL